MNRVLMKGNVMLIVSSKKLIKFQNIFSGVALLQWIYLKW